MLKPEELDAIGNALYGPRWIGPLARQLGVAWATLNRWRGDPNSPMPPRRLPGIAKILNDEAKDLAMTIKLAEARRTILMDLAVLVASNMAHSGVSPGDTDTTDAAPEASARTPRGWDRIEGGPETCETCGEIVANCLCSTARKQALEARQ